MDEFFKRRKLEVVLISSIIVLAALIGIMSIISFGYDVKPRGELKPVDITGKYSYDGVNWENLDKNSLKNLTEYDNVIIRGHVAEDIPVDEMLFLFVNNLSIEVRINGKTVYDFGRPGTYPSFSKAPGMAVGFVENKGIRTSDHIQIKIRNYYGTRSLDAYKVLFGQLCSGKGYAMYDFVDAKCGRMILIFLGIVVMAIFSISFYLSHKLNHKATTKAGLSLFFFELAAAFFLFVNEVSIYLPVIVKNPIVCNLVWVMPLHLVLIVWGCHMLNYIQSSKPQKVIFVCNIILVLNLCLMMAFQLLGIGDVYISYGYTIIVAAPVIIVMFMCIINEIISRKNYELKFVFLGFVPMTLAFVIEGVNFGFNMFPERIVTIIGITSTLVIQSLQIVDISRIKWEEKAKLNAEQNLNDKLKETMEREKRANEAKSKFLSNMSHDMRTPMNAIIGYKNIALANINDEDNVRSCLEKIGMSSEHLLKLINDVLDMSFIESGRMKIREKQCNLLKLIDDLVDMTKNQARSKNINLATDIEQIKEADVYVDELKLEQIMINVLGNAIKYTAEGGQVTLSLHELESFQKNYGRYEFIIADNGIGVSKEFLTYIFDPFEREKDSTESKIAGTGLGLSITKNMLKLMGGEISVESQEGSGTKFIIRINLRKRKHIVNNIVEGSKFDCDESVLQRKDSRTDKRVLLVEDNDMNREIAGVFLNEAGFKVEEAADGMIAIEKLSESDKNYYDIVLMDIKMPVLDGYAATTKIRQMDRDDIRNIPVVAMTANAFYEDKKEAKRCGMSGYLSKPIDFKKLIKLIDALLELS